LRWFNVQRAGNPVGKAAGLDWDERDFHQNQKKSNQIKKIKEYTVSDTQFRKFE
jgi:hypothetical protein